MKITVPLPFDVDASGDFCTFDAVTRVGKTLDDAGFDAGCVTDHPVPTGRWLDAGGHYAQDPFVMLSLLAAVTTKLRLQTGILVLPYRNPFVVARSVATLDLFSNGRAVLGVGAGYLKGEFRALGVPFDDRNDLMDEYLRALALALGGAEFAFEGTGYQAYGNRVLPGPLQQPHPPFLVGGNSPRAMRRAVELGDSWYPFLTKGVSTESTRTYSIGGVEDVAKGIGYLAEHSAKIGRAVPPSVVMGGVNGPGESWSAEQLIDEFGRYAEVGVESAGVWVAGDTVSEWCDNAARIGAEVIAKVS